MEGRPGMDQEAEEQATQWNQSCPCKTNTSQETEKSFLEPSLLTWWLESGSGLVVVRGWRCRVASRRPLPAVTWPCGDLWT